MSDQSTVIHFYIGRQGMPGTKLLFSLRGAFVPRVNDTVQYRPVTGEFRVAHVGIVYEAEKQTIHVSMTR